MFHSVNDLNYHIGLEAIFIFIAVPGCFYMSDFLIGKKDAFLFVPYIKNKIPVLTAQ